MQHSCEQDVGALQNNCSKLSKPATVAVACRMTVTVKKLTGCPCLCSQHALPDRVEAFSHVVSKDGQILL